MSASDPLVRMDVITEEQFNKLMALVEKADELLALNGLPAVTSSSNGKVLTVVSGKWKAQTPASQLPAVSADDNTKVLTVVEGAWAAANLPE